MKSTSYFRNFTVSLIIVIGGMLTIKPSMSQSARGFSCDTSSGSPTTIYQNSQGGREPWIHWNSDAFADSGYDPLTRCQQVSSRFETYRQNRQLKYITVGIMNEQNVICTASNVNGRCEGLLFTLKPEQDPIATLYKLLAWREGQAGVPSLSESGAAPYIDVSDRLEYNNTIAPDNILKNNIQPIAPQQPVNPINGGSRDL